MPELEVFGIEHSTGQPHSPLAPLEPAPQMMSDMLAAWIHTPGVMPG